MEIAARTPEPGEQVKSGGVEDFIMVNGIVPGDAPITPKHAWDSYREWSQDPVTDRMFYKYFKRHFIDTVQWKNGVKVYMLNPEPFINAEEVWKVREAARESYLNSRLRHDEQE